VPAEIAEEDLAYEFTEGPTDSLIPSQPILVNLDNDDSLEIVLSIGGEKVVILDSDLTTKWEYPLNTKYFCGLQPVASDINADGVVDLLIPNPEAGCVFAFDRDGNMIEYYGALSPLPTVTNINNDPYVEILTAGSGHVVATNSEAAKTTAGLLWLTKVNDESSFPGINFTPLASGPTVADLDNDGDLEIVTGDICILDHNGNIIKREAIGLGGRGHGVAVADLDNDGYLEIITGAKAYGYTGKHSIEMLWHCEEFNENDNIVYAPVVADLDSDGEREILIVDQKGYLHALNSTGQLLWSVYSLEDLPTFRTEAEMLYPGAQTQAPSLFDIKGDGKLEIVLATNYGSKVLDCNGNQIYFFNSPDANLDSSHMPLIADIDKDGKVDIVTTVPKNDASGSEVTIIANSLGACKTGEVFTTQYQIDPARTGEYTGNINTPPELSNVGVRFGTVGELLEFTITATDEDNDDLSFRAANSFGGSLPLGCEIINNSDNTATFRWIPEDNQSHWWWLEVFVSDGKDEVEENLLVCIRRPVPYLRISNCPNLTTLSGQSRIIVENRHAENISLTVLFSDNVFVGFKFGAPSTVNFNTLKVPNGKRSIRVQGFDTVLQRWVHSDPVTVVVEN